METKAVLAFFGAKTPAEKREALHLWKKAKRHYWWRYRLTFAYDYGNKCWTLSGEDGRSAHFTLEQLLDEPYATAKKFGRQNGKGE